jgi:hypothetical protein
MKPVRKSYLSKEHFCLRCNQATSSPLPLIMLTLFQVGLRHTVVELPMLTTSHLEMTSPHAAAGRTDDQTTMVGTILGAKQRVSIAVMDFVPSSMGLWSSGAPVYWPALTDALLRVVNVSSVHVCARVRACVCRVLEREKSILRLMTHLQISPKTPSRFAPPPSNTYVRTSTHASAHIQARSVSARVLVSQWAWTDPRMLPYLQALAATAAVCNIAMGGAKLSFGSVSSAGAESAGAGGDQASGSLHYHASTTSSTCQGTLEVRTYAVPGW